MIQAALVLAAVLVANTPDAWLALVSYTVVKTLLWYIKGFDW